MQINVCRVCVHSGTNNCTKCAARSWLNPITKSEVHDLLSKSTKVLLPRGSTGTTSEESSSSNGFLARTTPTQNWDTSSWSTTHSRNAHSRRPQVCEAWQHDILWQIARLQAAGEHGLSSSDGESLGKLHRSHYRHMHECHKGIYWSSVKRHVKLHWLSDRDQLPLRIDEFLWRDRHSKKCNDVFFDMIHLMANY